MPLDLRRPAGVLSRAVAIGCLVAVGTLTGCASTSTACPSWADFSDPADAYRQADAVVIGRVLGRDGEIRTDLGATRAYRFDVERAVKGDLAVGETRIGSRADPCDGTAGGYATGDLLRTRDRVLVSLQDEAGGPVTIAPGQGVTTFPAGTPLPSER